MKIAVASGKGGTGKTTLAVAMAIALRHTEPVWLLDCDVEEPNGHLFLDMEALDSEPVTVQVPRVDEEKCNGCGLCTELCQFNAIAQIKSGVMVFPELCHACGGCALVCPRGAISEYSRQMGSIRSGKAGNLTFVEGRTNVGEAMSTPAIRAVKQRAGGAALSIRDCPPGTACAMVEAVRDADFVLLVTEPTPFGLHDLGLAVDTVRQMDLPFGAVVNRSEQAERLIHDYCAQEHIDLLLEIPNDRRVAEMVSRGRSLLDALPALRQTLQAMAETIRLTVKERGQH